MATAPDDHHLPRCRTSFQIKPASLGERGRTVRCSSCGERWFVEPFAEARARAAASRPTRVERRSPPPDAGPARARRQAVARRARSRCGPGRPPARRGRSPAATRSPPSSPPPPVYQRLGLPIQLPLGVEFRELASAQRMSRAAGAGGHRRDRQRLRAAAALPPIRVALLDARPREIDSACSTRPSPALGPGALSRFEVSSAQPPPEARTSPSRSASRPEGERAHGPDGAGPGRGGRRPRQAGEVPVGAVLVGPGRHAARARPQPDRGAPRPTAHAEILVIRRGRAARHAPAGRLRSLRHARALPDVRVGREPRPAAADLLRGRGPQGRRRGPRAARLASSSCHHRPEVYGGIDERRPRRCCASSSRREPLPTARRPWCGGGGGGGGGEGGGRREVGGGGGGGERGDFRRGGRGGEKGGWGGEGRGERGGEGRGGRRGRGGGGE